MILEFNTIIAMGLMSLFLVIPFLIGLREWLEEKKAIADAGRRH